MKPELLNSLKNYKKKYIVNDLLAGLMVAIIALPLSIALGIQSVPANVGNGIQFGVITAIIAGFFISFLGGSRFQIGGPTAAFVVILYGYLANPEIGVLGLALAGIMAGALLIIMSLCKFGSVMKFFPYPITIGFTTGIGVTLLIGQIKDLFGLRVYSTTKALEKLLSYLEMIATFKVATFAVGVVGLLCVIIIPKINKKIPSALVAIAVCTLLTLLLNNVFDCGIATIGSTYGKVEAGFNPISFSSIEDVKLSALIVPAIVIAFLCAIESLLSATVASGMTGTSFNANQELMGQGVANIFSSLLGGLPATGAIARTAAGIENGAKSPLTGMFHAVFVLIMYFALMGVVGYIPLAVFAAILISVAINMSRFKLFSALTRFGIRDTIILIVTCALTIIFDLTYGVIGGVLVTIIANIQNFKRGVRFELSEGEEQIDIKVIGALFFFNASKLGDEIDKVIDKSNAFLIDLSECSGVDETALEKLGALGKRLECLGKSLIFTGHNEKTKARFEKFYQKI